MSARPETRGPGAMLCKLPANHVRQRKTEPKKCLLGSTALPLMVSPKRTNHGKSQAHPRNRPANPCPQPTHPTARSRSPAAAGRPHTFPPCIWVPCHRERLQRSRRSFPGWCRCRPPSPKRHNSFRIRSWTDRLWTPCRRYRPR